MAKRKPKLRMAVKEHDKVWVPTPEQTPEIAKLMKVKPKSDPVGEFLEGMGRFGWELAERHEHDDGCFSPEDGHKRCGYREDELVPVQLGIQGILAKYFDINLQRLSAEQDAVLEQIRARQRRK